eukprot:g11516.t1
MKINSRKRRFYHPQDSLRVFMYAHPGVFSGKDFCPPTGGWYHAIESISARRRGGGTTFNCRRKWVSHHPSKLNRTETAVRTVLDRASLAGLSGSGSAAQAEVDVLKKVGDEWDAISSRDPTKTAEFESGIRKAQGAPKVVRKTLASTSLESERRGSPRPVVSRSSPALPRLYGHADDVYKGPGLGFLFDAVEGEDADGVRAGSHERAEGEGNLRRVRGCQHALQSSPAMKRLQKATLLEMARVLNDENTE